jgi:uncharacterized membrane-anchored protein YjiN (DUF445 family)
VLGAARFRVRRLFGNAEGRRRRLELLVGKDLQYIRINGLLVGGVVGLLIFTM